MRAPFLAWPGWRHLGWAVVLALPLTVWWYAIYAGADWITGQRAYRVRVHFDAELAMPYWPPMVVFYNSVYLLYVLTPFVLRDRKLTHFALTHAAVDLAAGVCFLLFPAELAYEPPPDAGVWEAVMRSTREIALTYNLAPSLHVALAVICVAIFAPRAPLWARILFWGWAVAIAASTLLLHQHHVVDVLTGWALGLAGNRYVFDALVSGGVIPRSPGQSSPASQSTHRAPPA